METCGKCGSIRLRQYGERWKCLDCAKARSSARRRGEEQGGGRPSKQETRARHIQVAALAGAGQPIRAIAKASGYSKRTVSEILNEKMPNDTGLQRIFQDAQAELAPLAIETARDALRAAHRGVVEGYEVVAGRDKEGKAIVQKIPCPPDKAAVVAREAHNIGWDYTRGRGEPGDASAQPGLQINLNDPAVVASFVEALRMLNDPEPSRVIEVTPEYPPDATG